MGVFVYLAPLFTPEEFVSEFRVKVRAQVILCRLGKPLAHSATVLGAQRRVGDTGVVCMRCEANASLQLATLWTTVLWGAEVIAGRTSALAIEDL